MRGGETWGKASRHSVARAAWLVSWIAVAVFVLAGIGLTVGPILLIWIGATIAVVTGAFGMATHVWSDYRRERESAGSGAPADR
jgi:fatty acid desaturase